MLTNKRLLLLSLVAATLMTAQSIAGQEPGTRCTRYKAGSGKQKSSKPQAPRGVKDLDTLAEALKAQGLNVERAGDVSQPFFSVEGHALNVDGENVQVFQYRTAGAAEKEAGQVSPDGSSVGASIMSWVGTPHFFKREKIIVLYVGDNPRVLDALRAALGVQFAGR
ncbi:MAG: hypothetical protein M3416_04915 [Acidobacteriota bacterium]|nr:hypothetical protein [Acidobacteriota bacterium]